MQRLKSELLHTTTLVSQPISELIQLLQKLHIYLGIYLSIFLDAGLYT